MKAHLQYLRYVIRHKAFVFVAGLHIGPPSRLAWPLWILRLLVHDWSKFLPSEWGPYVQYFYGPKDAEWKLQWCAREWAFIRTSGASPAVRPEEVVDEYWPREKERRRQRFDRAWNFHQKRNPHHWQFWILRNDSGTTAQIPMPEVCIREMVADWMGAARAITGRWEAREWYQNNRHVIALHPETRKRVEFILRGQRTRRPPRPRGDTRTLAFSS